MIFYIIVQLIFYFELSESNYSVSWKNLENLTQKSFVNFIQSNEQIFQEVINETQLNQKCQQALLSYKNNLLNFELTSLKRLDSTGKWPTGLLSGTFTDLGSYDTCISLQSTQYCLLYTNVPLMPEHGYEGFMRPYDPKLFNFSTEPFKFFQKYIHFLRQMNITTGLCVPKECSRFELTNFISSFYQHFNTGLTANVDLCYSKPEQIPWRVSEIFGLTLVLIIIVLNIFGILSSPSSFLQCFNCRENLRKLLTTKESSSPFDCLHGIKVATMLLVILAHLQMGIMFQLFSETFNFIEAIHQPIYLLIFLSPYTVDLFLTISGLLIGHYFFSTQKPFQLIPYVIGRWIRFATCIGWIICLEFIFFADHFRSYVGGPFWTDYAATGSIIKSCERTWLSTLLLSRFWFNSSKDINVCLLFDWYLSADFYLALVFLLVLWPYLKGHRYLALINIGLLILVGLLFSGLTIYQFDIPTTWVVTNFQRQPLIRYSFEYNLKPWPHLGPYFVGVLFGYLISHVGKKLSKITQTFGWFLSLTCLTTNFLYEFFVNRKGLDFEYSLALTYGILSKTLWSFGWSWIIFVLQRGQFPRISGHLSHPVYQVLSRISLSVLTVQPLVIRLRSATSRTLVYPRVMEIILFQYLPMYFLIYSVALISAVLIEYPTVNLLKFIFLSKSDKSSVANKNAERNKLKDKRSSIETDCC